MRPILSGMVLRSQTDERLVALTRDGHDQAFVAIAERYRRELMAHAGRMAPRDGCEDIVQQAMLSAWDALRRQADVRDPRAWLHRIVHNAALSAARSCVDHEPLSESFAADGSAEGDLERRLGATAALAALAALPERQRRAVELTAIEGRSGREAAWELGMSEGALRQLVHRARSTLRSGTTALIPLPLVAWLAGGTNETVAGRIGEICAGAGMAGAASKIGATIAVTAAVIGGATQTLPSGHAPTAHHQQATAAHRLSSRGAPGPVNGNRVTLTALAVPSAPIDPPRNSSRIARQHGQQQHGTATGASQSHQSGANQHATSLTSAGSGARGTSRNDHTSQSATANTSLGNTGINNPRGSGSQPTGAQGGNGASGAH